MQPRLLVTLVIGALVLLSVVLPHVAVTSSDWPRSLIPAGLYFLNAQPSMLGPGVAASQLITALTVTYLGLGFHQLGALLALLTFWLLAADDMNRWLYRLLVISGWMLTLCVPPVLIGSRLLDRAGVPATPGWAWLPTLLAGVLIIVACRRSRDRIDDTWYVARPELQ